MAAEVAAGNNVDTDHVIDILDDDGVAHPPEQPPDCAVCMEPLEWVAVGACGHHAVCAKCAVRLRSVEGDRRCCICRAHCRTVVVTSAAAGGDRRRAFSELVRVVAFFPDLLVGRYWYHGVSRVYFDDEKQYETVMKARENEVDWDGVDRASLCCPPVTVLLVFIFLAICFFLDLAISEFD